MFCSLAVLLLNISRFLSEDEPELRLLCGRVSDDAGKPLAGVLVEWGDFDAHPEDRESVRTGNDGSFRLETRKYGPDFRLGVSAEGWGPRWAHGVIPAPIDRPEPRHFELLKPVEVYGQVLDDDGKPIANVVVIARSESRGFYSSFSMPTPSYLFPGPAHEATTDQNGNFTIRNLPSEKASGFIAPRPGPNPAASRDYYKFDLSVRSSETTRMPCGTAVPGEYAAIQISRDDVTDSKRSGVLKARVFNAETGQPIEQFRIVRRHVPVMEPIVNVDGKFELMSLTVGRDYQVFVYADGFAPFVMREPASEDASAKYFPCPLKKSPGFQGMIVDSNDNPISGVEIVAGAARESSEDRFYRGDFDKYVDGNMGWEFVQRVTTAEDGKFLLCLGDLPYSLAVKAHGKSQEFFRPTDLPKPDSEGLVKISLVDECCLRVMVKKNGKPEPNAGLYLSRKDSWDLDFGEIKANEEGRCEIGGLQPGTYLVSVYHRSGRTRTSRLSRWVTLAASETIDVEMEKPDGQFSLSGKADPFVMISLRAKGEQLYSNVGAVTDVDGNYRIDGLTAGTYELSTHRSLGVTGYFHRDRGMEIKISGDTIHDVKDVFPFR